MSDPEPEKCLTTEAAAADIGVSEATLAEWLRRGRMASGGGKIEPEDLGQAAAAVANLKDAYGGNPFLLQAAARTLDVEELLDDAVFLS